MSELRWHPFLQEWVITATHRQDRTFFPPDDYCPLCPTKPGGFPTEVPMDDYDIVVFENKFPSLKRNPYQPDVPGYDYSPVDVSAGVCEVVCYTPDHTATLADMPHAQIRKLVEVWTERFEELGNRPEVKYVFIFENKGKEIGVTLNHPHGQIYAYPFIPPKAIVELDAAKKWYDEHKTDLMGHIVQSEIAEQTRVVAQNEDWLAYIPFFARYPYELYITPIEFRSCLTDLSDSEKDSFTQMLRCVVRKFDRLFGKSLPYMMVMHQRPTDGKEYPDYRFHVEFYPPYRTADKLKYLAGSESGAGVFINDTLPEQTAKILRDLPWD